MGEVIDLDDLTDSCSIVDLVEVKEEMDLSDREREEREQAVKSEAQDDSGSEEGYQQEFDQDISESLSDVGVEDMMDTYDLDHVAQPKLCGFIHDRIRPNVNLQTIRMSNIIFEREGMERLFKKANVTVVFERANLGGD